MCACVSVGPTDPAPNRTTSPPALARLSWQAVQDVTHAGRVCVLDIAIQGVRAVRGGASALPCVAWFVKPPTVEALLTRLRERGTESEADVHRRVERARQEIEEALAAQGSGEHAARSSLLLSLTPSSHTHHTAALFPRRCRPQSSSTTRWPTSPCERPSLAPRRFCGAISRPMEIALTGAGIKVISNPCGQVEQVWNAFLNGRVNDREYQMPGSLHWRIRRLEAPYGGEGSDAHL